MTKRTTRPSTAPRTRTVYEVRHLDARPVTVEAASAAELAAELGRATDLDPQDCRAVAHVAHVLRGSVTSSRATVRRLGVLEFRPDADGQAEPRRAATAGQTPPSLAGAGLSAALAAEGLSGSPTPALDAAKAHEAAQRQQEQDGQEAP